MTKLKTSLRCRKCWFSFLYNGTETRTFCPECGNRIDTRDRSEYSKTRKEHFQNLARTKKTKSKAASQNLHKSALFVVHGSTNVKCNHCDCDDIRLLEINHKNGGGGKEMKNRSTYFYRDIVHFRRDTSDLEVSCRVCNALHFLELKFGKLPFTVTYNKG